ncbi:MAG TPA: hypothetical protein VFL12_09190 [Thermoanaerobaculia bacterium]|nr:hypothetical protein [Thermoanaerobaculia bacterium]
MNRDFVEMLSALSAEGAEYLLVGAHALSVYGIPRSTGDMDLWIRPSAENARRVWRALEAYGAPLADLSVADLTEPEVVLQFGVPPNRIDILTTLTGLDFDSAWGRRIPSRVENLDISVLGRDDFVANKRAVGRAKDLSDLALLEGDDQQSGRR